MAKKRFHAFVKPYTGKTQKKMLKSQKKLEWGGRIDTYINSQLTDEPQTFMYYEIADAMGSTKEKVRSVLFACGGGSGGITL
jgi:hypothetical protein